MAFINELIPERDKLKIQQIALQNNIKADDISSRWIFDRELDAYMVRTAGGARGIFDYYLFVIAGEVISFRGDGLATPINGDRANGFNLERWVFEIKYPQNLKVEEKLILQLIEEANLAQGNNISYLREQIKSVQTHFQHPVIENQNW